MCRRVVLTYTRRAVLKLVAVCALGLLPATVGYAQPSPSGVSAAVLPEKARVYVGIVEPRFDGVQPIHLNALKELAQSLVAELKDGPDPSVFEIDTEQWLSELWVPEIGWAKLAEEGKTHFIIIHAELGTRSIGFGDQRVDDIIRVSWEVGKIIFQKNLNQPKLISVKMMGANSDLYLGLRKAASEQKAEFGVIRGGWVPLFSAKSALQSQNVVEEMRKLMPDLRQKFKYFVACLSADSVPADRQMKWNVIRRKVLQRVFDVLRSEPKVVYFLDDDVLGRQEAQRICDDNPQNVFAGARDNSDYQVEGAAFRLTQERQEITITFKDFGYERRYKLVYPEFRVKPEVRGEIEAAAREYQTIRGMGSEFSLCVPGKMIWPDPNEDLGNVPDNFWNDLSIMLARAILQRLFPEKYFGIPDRPCESGSR